MDFNTSSANRNSSIRVANDIKQNTKNAISPGATTYLSGTKKFTGPFFAITALTDTVFDASQCTLNINESDDSGAMRAITTDLAIVAGITIYGNFASIELDSGTAVAYSEVNVTVTVES